MRYNDIPIDARIIPGTYYFVKHKRKKNSHNIYQAKPSDNLWAISQQQGIQLKYLKKYNPSLGDQALNPNTIVRLNRSKLMEPIPIEDNGEVAELGNEAFAWSIRPNPKVTQVVRVAADSAVFQKQENNKPDALDSLVISTAQSSTSEAEKSNIIMYEVKTSDTLYGIARQFGATIKDIMEWNNKSSLTINPGEKLKIMRR
jgi:membrane-bound lytic murein transglycosylase D